MRLLTISVVFNYYNVPHIMMLFFAPIFFFATFLPLRKKDEKTKLRVLMIICYCNCVLFTVYKIFMGLTYDSFVLLNELPLHLCNICVILLPIAIRTKNKFLTSYLYFVASIGAILAVMFLDPTFVGKSILDFGALSYFLYHSILFSTIIAIPALRIFSPKLSDILKAHLTLAILAVAMHIVNTIMRISGLCDIANYFYTYGDPLNPLLNFMYELIPVPVLFFFPILPPVALLNCLMCVPFLKYNKRQCEAAV